MMQQMIYTRCRPYRYLSTDRVVDTLEGGEGVFSYSSGLMTQKELFDYSFLEEIAKYGNPASEFGNNVTGIFPSYIYATPLFGKQIIGRDILRHKTQEVRSNGKAHRPGNHVKQFFVGDIEFLPCSLFENNIWDADKKTENSYYHDNNEPVDLLPEVDFDENVDLSSCYDEIRNFINDGRSDAFKHLLNCVINEMSLGSNERKFIVIKDYPKNVEKWITAIELVLPRNLALKISFNTCVKGEDKYSQKNVYYVDENRKFIKEKGNKDNKNFYYMIVGLHPEAAGTSEVKANRFDNEFYFLDHSTLTLNYECDVSLNREYYNAASAFDKDIIDYITLLNEFRNLEFGDSIADLYSLYDAYMFFLDRDSDPKVWKYDKTVRYLNILSKYDYSQKWTKYIAKKILSVLQKYIGVDLNNSFELVSKLNSICPDKEDIINKELVSYCSQLLVDDNCTNELVLNKLIKIDRYDPSVFSLLLEEYNNNDQNKQFYARIGSLFDDIQIDNDVEKLAIQFEKYREKYELPLSRTFIISILYKLRQLEVDNRIMLLDELSRQYSISIYRIDVDSLIMLLEQRFYDNRVLRILLNFVSKSNKDVMYYIIQKSIRDVNDIMRLVYLSQSDLYIDELLSFYVKQHNTKMIEKDIIKRMGKKDYQGSIYNSFIEKNTVDENNAKTTFFQSFFRKDK